MSEKSLPIDGGTSQPPELPDDHVEVVGLLETCLEESRRGAYHSILLVTFSEDETTLHAHIEPGYELSAICGLDSLKGEILDGRVDG